ncbi:unknown [Bacteroides sp. CAG:545]|nr:unknown [Bacteroides sp. CAG:545]
MPSISPVAVIRSQNGEKIFTAASASLPTPCPMNTPSITVITEMHSIPSKVGRSILLKSFGMLSEPKSMASLCIQSSFQKMRSYEK